MNVTVTNKETIKTNFQDEEKLDSIACELQSLGILIDALLAQIKDGDEPSEEILENMRIFLQKRFDESFDGINQILENNRFVSVEALAAAERRINQEEKNSEDTKKSITEIAEGLEISIEELANRSGMDLEHMQQITDGTAKMTAEDLYRISKGTGIPADSIAI